MRHLLQPASEGDRLLGDQRLANLELDLRVPIERDVARVALVQLAVVDGHYVALVRPEYRWPERLAPLVEEVAERVGALYGRLDVDDAVWRVGVQPVKA